MAYLHGYYGADHYIAFNRTAVVIWPKNKTLSLLYDGASLAHTCEELVNTTTPEVNHLIELIVARAGENPTVAWNSLCGVASRRNDAALWKHWTKSLSASHGIAGLSGQNVIDAIRLFGWAALCPTYVARYVYIPVVCF